MDFLYRFLSSRLAVLVSVVLILALTAAAVFRIIPWWLLFSILAAAIVGIVAYSIVSEWLALRRDRSFEKGMHAQAEEQVAHRKARDRDAVREMHERWQEGLERLRLSRVGKRRRALYFLPWYLIIGKPATGKTTAIKNSGLHFPLGMPKTAGTGGTRNCDWFFAEEAILLDTAGRYTESDENPADHQEWIAFLQLMRKYRRDAPINGLLVAVAADELLGREPSEAAADARRMRAKLDELIRELGIQFPIYLIVTKCDLIQGFTDFFGRLPKTRLTELLGWTNPSWEMGDVGQLLEGAFTGLVERAENLRLVFLRDEQEPSGQRNVYLFPEELRLLSQSLTQYCDVLFRETRYNESPFLRGIYLTSGMQTGTIVSRMLDRLGLKGQSTRQSEGSRSYFLQDFFQERLKTDRQLIAPTGRATVQFRIANNLGLAAVAVVCVIFSLFATASYVRNRTLLLSIQDSVIASGGLDGKPVPQQLSALDRFLASIQTLRERNRHRAWLERLGLYSGTAAERPVVERFLRSFDRVAYRPALDSADAALRNRADVPKAFSAFAAVIAYLADTKAAHTHDLETGGESLAQSWSAIAPTDADSRGHFAAGYRFFIREPWWPEESAPARQRAEQQRTEQLALARERLPYLLTVPTVKAWLEKVQKADRPADLGLPANTAFVHPAFTLAARQERVVPLLAAVDQLQGELDANVTANFARDYAAQYHREWLNFLLGLRAPATDSAFDPRYCDTRSPYFAAFTVAQTATTVPFPSVEAPKWVSTPGRLVGQKDAYLELIADACTSAAASDQEGSAACSQSIQFGGAENAPQSRVTQLRDQIRKLVAVDTAADGDDRKLRENAARLLMLPIDRAAGAGTKGCQDHLRAQLLKALEPFPAHPPWTLEQIEAIFAPSRGAVWQYCDHTLSPFFDCQLVKGKPGSPVQVPEAIVAFTQMSHDISLLLFDHSGGWKKHTLAFESIPSSDIGAGAHVTQTVLTVSCSNTAEQPWTLRHRNTLVKKTLSWEPDQCDEARLQLTLGAPDGHLGGERVIELSRSGPFGLLDLLREARQEGNEFRWTFPNDGVTAAFRLSLPNPGLLKYNAIELPR